MRSLDLSVVETAHLPMQAAEKLADVLCDAVRTGGRACIALAGGTTPRAVHEALATLPDIPWDRIHVFFGDERCVPREHPDSNYRMAKESLLDRVPIPSSQIHRPDGERRDRDAAARAYEAILPAAFDLVVLGIGEDGHTASLFPGSPALNERERRCIPVIGPKPPPERLTLTPPVLEAARAVIVLAVGAGKAEATARALEGAWDPLGTPAQLVRKASWYVDPPAAKLLGRS